MYRYWTNPDNEALLRKAVKQARSFREVLRILGLVQAGGNYHNIRHHISRLDLDISHFLGQGWNKAQKICGGGVIGRHGGFKPRCRKA